MQGDFPVSFGSFTDIPRENYVSPEEKTITELKNLGKPFIVLLNSVNPRSERTLAIARELSEGWD